MRPLTYGGAALRPRSFAALSGWDTTDVHAASASFWASARALVERAPPLRPAIPADAALLRACARTLSAPKPADAAQARAFFEAEFEAFELELADGRPGFLTGYYEPVVDAAWERSEAFRAPVLPRPADLMTFDAADHPRTIPPGITAGRKDRAGMPHPYAGRAELEAFALTPSARPVAWLRDWTEVFLIHVQGSARVRLPDGSQRRLVYAGRNGLPYTSIGRRLVETGRMSAADMSLDRLKGWLREHGQEPGDEGRRLMQENQSYIFFRLDESDGASAGPIGGAGLPLDALSSIAIDRAVWSYGTPFWIATDGPVPGFGPAPLARLFVAQDTGSAIVGPARADLFLGSGDAAGRNAGSVRHAARFTVLLPRP